MTPGAGLELRTNTSGSPGPDHDRVDGKFEPSSPRTGHRRGTRQVGPPGTRRWLYVTHLFFRLMLVLSPFLAPLLEKECAVCKDPFSLKTEDPDEQVIVTLPCKHPFHSPCILPWLKQNGTCPSCRYQLVPQPGHTSGPNENPVPGPSTATPNPPRPTASRNPFAQPRTDNSSSRWSALSRDRDRDRGASPESSDGGGGFLGMVGHLLHSLAGGHTHSGPAPSNSGSGAGPLPGSWETGPSPRPESGNGPSHSSNQTTQSNQGIYSSTGSTRSPSSAGSTYGQGMYSNSGPTRSASLPYDRGGSTFGSSYDPSSNYRDRNGDSTPDWASRALGRNRRGNYDRERERNRDRNGQRRNTQPWDNPELD